MANHKSALKRVRQTKTRTELNKSRRSAVRGQVKKIRTAIEAKNKEEAQKLLPLVQKLFSRAATKGAMNAKTASRRTSRLAEQIASL